VTAARGPKPIALAGRDYIAGMTASSTAWRVGGSALLLVLSIAASAQGAVAAVPIVQLRVTDGPRCTGTVVSARFVLTAAHCTRGNEASLGKL
jgi:secreted trypsin-like serine protease